MVDVLSEVVIIGRERIPIEVYSIVLGGPIVITTLTVPVPVIGVAYSTLIYAQGGSSAGYAWSLVAGALPPGLSLSAVGTPAATLSGTPTASGTFTFTVRVTDDTGFTYDDQEYTVEIEALPIAIVVVPASDTIRGGAVIFLGSPQLEVETGDDAALEGVLPAGWSVAATLGSRAAAGSEGVELAASSLGLATLTGPALLGAGEASIEVRAPARGRVVISSGTLQLALVGSARGEVGASAALGALPGSALVPFGRAGDWLRVSLIRTSEGGPAAQAWVWAALSSVDPAGEVGALGADRWVLLSAPSGGAGAGAWTVQASAGGATRVRRATVRAAVSVDGGLLLRTRAEVPGRIVGVVPSTSLGRVGVRDLCAFGPFGEVAAVGAFAYTLPVGRTAGSNRGLVVFSDPALRDSGPRIPLEETPVV